MRRKLLACLVVSATLALCLALTGCGGASQDAASSSEAASDTAQPATADDAASDTAQPATADDAASEQASSKIDKTIVDDDLCTIKVLDTFGDEDVVGYNVEITNKSDKTLTFMTGGESGSSTVDGKEVSVTIYAEVEAGQTAKSDFDYWTSDLGGGVEKLVNAKGQINVNDMSIPDTIATYEFAL